jgi:acyl-CoA synthetase (AMP-forming)/AMP-acid ligase II/thioesterase domain-containing protein
MFPDLKNCGSIDDVGLGLRWDAGTLSLEVARRAAVLAHFGIGPGSVVAISHSGSAYFFGDLLAVWAVGAAAACLDGALTDVELRTVTEFAAPALLLVNKPETSTTPAVPTLELADSRPPVPSAEYGTAGFDPDRPALILFTSGTTGSPKGVVLSYRALQTRIELNAAVIGAAALNQTLVTLPTHFGHGLIGNALTALLTGGNIVLYPPGDMLGNQLGRVIDKHSIRFLSSVPALWNLVKRSSDQPAGNSLVRVHVGSAPLSANLWKEIAAWSGAEVVNCYGMTEAANWISGASSHADSIVDGLVGKTWGGRAAVIDDRGIPQGSGEGEIVIRSPCLMSGYLNRPDLTAGSMTDGWFRTGDRGAIDDLGRIWLTGRIKDEINRAGFKVQPAELDLMLQSHPAVAEACVFGIPDPICGEVIGAAVRLEKHAAADTDSLRAWCRNRLRRDAVPERWFIVDSIPRNSRGKVNREAVRRGLVEATNTLRSEIDNHRPHAATATGRVGNCAESDEGPTHADAANRVLAAVERAWASVLDRRSFQANTQWDLAGGDSIGAMRMWLQIEEQLGMPLPMDRLEFNTTPSRLIYVVQKLLENGGERERVDRLPQQQPLIFLMPPAHGYTPSLARFRAALDGRVRFEIIRYPQIDELIDGGAEFNVLVDAAVAQIVGKGNDEEYYLAGYSFGGFVALETARRLLGAGHQVGFLGLIDTRLVAPPQKRRSIVAKASDYLRRLRLRSTSWTKETHEVAIHPLATFIASFWGACAAGYQDFLWWFIEKLTRNCPWSVLRQIDRLARSIPGSTAFAFQLELTARLRLHALQRLTVKPLNVPATLFRSDECCADLPDYGWGRVCERLSVLPIRGGHLSVFEPEFQETLCIRFLQAVKAAQLRKPIDVSRTGS